VRDEIYNDLIAAGNMTREDLGPMESIFGYGGIGTKITQLWKMFKVALNPPTQIRNFLSNGILLHLSGVPFHRTPKRVVEAIREMRTNGKHWRIAKKYGITASTFANNELFRIEKRMLEVLAKKELTPMAQLKLMAATIGKASSELYGLSEGVFKTAKIIDAMKADGLSEGDAVLEAQKALYDYSLTTKTVRWFRNAPIGMPFVTFYYKTLPRMLETMLKHPVRFLPYAIIPQLLSEAIQAYYDVDDDDVKKLKKAMPGFLNDKATAYVLPYKDQYGRWQAVNFEYFMPWSMFTEVASEAGKGEYAKAIKSTGVFGGPIPDIVTAIKTNRDSFTGKEIVNEADPPVDQVMAMLGYVWNMGAPGWLTDSGFTGHMKKAITKELKRNQDLPLTEGQAMMRLFGVNIYPYEPLEQRRRNIRWMNFEIKELRKRMGSKLRNKNLSDEDKQEIRRVYREMIKEKRELIKQYRADSEINPKLTK
jgi:hypothetical protein